MKHSSSIAKIIAPDIESMGYQFLGLEVSSQSNFSVFRIYIDADSGITPNDCHRVNRHLISLLEVQLSGKIRGQYSLEVSSPGIDRRLFTMTQCKKQIGSHIKIHLIIPQNGKRTYEGILNDAKENILYVKIDDIEEKFNFDNTQKVNVVPQW